MKERPILFNAPMVRAILAGTKTQTRRVVMPPRKKGCHDLDALAQHQRGLCPYGRPGDRLWVREAWRAFKDGALYEDAGVEVDYRATPAAWAKDSDAPWKPSIHMPRWASRITLEITDVRVERLQEICASANDILAEGIIYDADAPVIGPCEADAGDLVEQFSDLWDSINSPGSWDENPWVWVIEFKRVTP